MPGISSVLNIAKEALVAHQLAIGVTGHNVANVNTPGYTRQTVGLSSTISTPIGVGFMGNGVQAVNIERQYDRFMVQRLVSQESNLSNLEAQYQSMRVVETAFNEAPGMAVNELLSEFWVGWQEIANNPEFISSRENVVQQAYLINEQLHIMASEIAQSREDISANLHSSIVDVNTLTAQIAKLNVNISSSESDINKQNDLRDQRDELTKELAQFVDLNYFEMSNGAYTIMLKDGHTLVENNASWSLAWDEKNLAWQTTNANGQMTLTNIGGEELGGKIGGWMEVHGELIEGQPENYLGRLDALANSLIREVNQLHTQGVGLVRFSDTLRSTTPAANTTILQSTVDAATALEDIAAGTFDINGREVGRIDGAIAVSGVAMGKTANAVQAINDSLSAVKARMTTLVAGKAVTPPPLVAGETMDFTINGVAISYTTVAADISNQPGLAANLVNAINTAITAYNTATGPINIPKVTLSAMVGTGSNGGALNSIILKNDNPGDESQIVLAGIDPSGASPDQKLGLTNGTYVADASHNSGEITFFNNDGPIEIDGGSTDVFLTHLGLDGGTFGNADNPGDGKIFFEYTDGGLAASMMGYAYSDELVTDGTSFDIWLYNSDNTLALPMPVQVPMDRVTTLSDVAHAINVAVENASGVSPTWLTATVEENKLVLTPDASHSFAFDGDTSNFLATAGLNTFFTGHSAATIGVNSQVADSLEYVAAGQVDDYGQIFTGDQANALLITNIQNQEDIHFTGASNNTLDGHYNALVSTIGIKSSAVEGDYEYNSLVTTQLQEMRDATSAVNLDEEMANLIKFQHAYTAAAKLISISDEMMLTLLNSLNR
ncbi:MAG: flagellar hook-associated protein FlgK [Proteobacteria bacterium]|nr:flagellar hook-associated protein FlgK [Pseudomonadota bacterium]MBU1639858.1 flagellar hook-associated protein FlgK [Pseudomonadota bacterium]